MDEPNWKSIGFTLVAELEKIPPEDHLDYIHKRVAELPLSSDVRELISHFVVATIYAAKSGGVKMPEDRQSSVWEKATAAFCGVGFMIALIVLAIAFPEPTLFQYEVFRIILSVAVAGFVAVIPGLLHVEIPGIAKGTGALAVFLLVYFYNPAQLVVEL
nr:hypothetical protein [uncultured Cohaesibacter sp.]